ncbi:prolow-density lipoprotein receptor-related protein 1-like isoform X2 [Planococcus citri]|uniref:prolow-density lipoprotein receptor-related protein 1-like isoform X2 n=1 Tax=Planococcus citri TaxID=170843 RepID=UPI0031F7D20E
MVCAGVGKVVLFVWLISEVYYVEAFRCNNGKLIGDQQFCDRIDDCGDLSDETFGCDSDSPRTGWFRCEQDHYTIVVIRQRCDMKADCQDGSDERNCGDQITIENCTIHNGKYLCKDRSRCIDFEYTCDFRLDCDDGSDENQDNCAKYESSFNSCASCPHFCVPTPNGPECACNSSTYESSELCKQIEDCTLSDTRCDQFCSKYRSRTKCFCHEDYYLDAHNECRTNVSYGNILIYSTATKIKSLNKTSAQLQVLQHGVNCTALTAANDFIYFATFDSKNRKGHVVKSLIRTTKSDVVLESGSYVTSIAVDWITNNIYFTTNESLSVCSNNGRICAEINVCKVDYVALAPEFGWMYFSQQTDYVDERLIIRSNMDGSDRRILTDGSYQFPVVLAVDEITETVYWHETITMRLHLTSFQGTRKQVFGKLFVTFNAFEGYLFGSIGDNEIYKSRWNTHARPIYHNDGSTKTVKLIFAYNPLLLHAGKVKNPCALASCNGLCVLSSSSTARGLNYSCICENFTPSNSNRWCQHSPSSVSDFGSPLNHQCNLALEKPALVSPATESHPATKFPQSFVTKKDDELQIPIGKPTISTILSLDPRAESMLSILVVEGAISVIILSILTVISSYTFYVIYREYVRKPHREVNVTELMDM